MRNIVNLLSVLAVAVGVVGCGSGSSDSGTGSGSAGSDTKLQAAIAVDATCGRPDFNAVMLASINARRAAGAVCGATAFPPATPLAWSNAIRNAATMHAQDLASRAAIPASSAEAHAGLDGSNGGQRMQAAGYSWSAWGEVIHYGGSSVEGAVSGWMNSPGHCSFVMDGAFKNVGSGCISGNVGPYYVAGFGK